MLSDDVINTREVVRWEEGGITKIHKLKVLDGEAGSGEGVFVMGQWRILGIKKDIFTNKVSMNSEGIKLCQPSNACI